MTQKTLAPVRFVPSKHALLFALLVTALATLFLTYFSPVAGFILGPCMALIAAHEARRCPPPLSYVKEERWQHMDDRAEWLPARVQVVYLGRVLIGLKVERRLYWVWPDSAEPQALWHFRRLCSAEFQR